MSALTDSTGRPLPPLETPSGDALRVYGDLAFLAFRSPRHQQMQMALLRRYIEPPVALGQFRVFRIDGVPRAAVTWGFLSVAAERKLVAGHALNPKDWQSGDRMWIIDLIAPYKGLTKGIVRWLMVPGNLTDTAFRYRRVDAENNTRRIVEIDFQSPDLARVYDEDRFLAGKAHKGHWRARLRKKSPGG